jgi:hypothetical protein
METLVPTVSTDRSAHPPQGHVRVNGEEPVKTPVNVETSKQLRNPQRPALPSKAMTPQGASQQQSAVVVGADEGNPDDNSGKISENIDISRSEDIINRLQAQIEYLQQKLSSVLAFAQQTFEEYAHRINSELVRVTHELLSANHVIDALKKEVISAQAAAAQTHKRLANAYIKDNRSGLFVAYSQVHGSQRIKTDNDKSIDHSCLVGTPVSDRSHLGLPNSVKHHTNGHRRKGSESNARGDMAVVSRKVKTVTLVAPEKLKAEQDHTEHSRAGSDIYRSHQTRFTSPTPLLRARSPKHEGFHDGTPAAPLSSVSDVSRTFTPTANGNVYTSSDMTPHTRTPQTRASRSSPEDFPHTGLLLTPFHRIEVHERMTILVVISLGLM